MKPKWIFRIVGVIMILSIFSISLGADKFYYGTYHRWWIGDYSEHYPYMKDSLRFNIVEDVDSTFDHIQVLADNALRTIVEGNGESSPTHWSSISHYTLWEAEGLEGSYYKLSYNGGTLVNDASASGGKARRFTGPGTPGLIQTGPTYYQEPEYRPGQSIEYTAEFRLKFWYYLDKPLGAMGPGPPPTTKVCSLMVVDRGTVLKDTVLYKSDFPSSAYQTFELKDYTVPEDNLIEFQIYWFAPPEAWQFYIDYVKTYDENGDRLMSGLKDSVITAYVSQDWVHETIPETGETVVYRWYLRDEPKYIDSFEPSRYIDSLLRAVSQERVSNQAFNHYRDDTLEHEYLLRQNPEEYHVDIYPTSCCWGPDSSGQMFQQGVSYFTSLLNTCKCEAESRNKDLWVTIQTFLDGWQVASCESCAYYCHQYGGQWYCSYLSRLPTPNEVRFQTFLALCYGADAILNFCYYSGIDKTDSTKWLLWLGLYNFTPDSADSDSATDMWREIKNFTGPRVEALGPIFNQLEWQGAGFHEDTATITESFIDSLKPAPGETLLTTYVEVGFFKDDADTDYFMLVNRQCLENKDQNVTVYMDSAQIGSNKMWYVIDQYSQDTTFTGAINGVIPFTTHLAPGEGKLFKLAASPDSAFHGYAHPLTWQGGIMVDIDVTVDSGKILVILDSNCSSQ